MTTRIAITTAVAAAALVVGAPAAFADPSGADRPAQTTFAGSPDVVDRAVAARQAELERKLDALEYPTRLTYAPSALQSKGSLGARRADYAPSELQKQYVGDGGDGRFRIQPAIVSTSAGSTDPGSEIVWPQIALGVLLGIGLALGLMLILKTTRGRALAH